MQAEIKIIKTSLFALAMMVCTVSIAIADVTVNESSDYFDSGVGDYAFVAGDGIASSPGQVIEVLGGALGGSASLQDNGSETGAYTVDMSQLYNTLDAGGVTSASTLVFGFGLNENGPIGSNYVDITSLDMTFNRESDPAVSYSLGSDTVTVYNYVQGANSAEALFAVDLGFDFMQEYDGASTELFEISSDISNTSDGFEIYFLSSAYTAAVVPEPVSTALFLVGGATLGIGRLRKRNSGK